jgi:hypothetical protein
VYYSVLFHYGGIQITGASEQENGRSGPKTERRKQQGEKIRNE